MPEIEILNMIQIEIEKLRGLRGQEGAKEQAEKVKALCKKYLLEDD